MGVSSVVEEQSTRQNVFSSTLQYFTKALGAEKKKNGKEAEPDCVKSVIDGDRQISHLPSISLKHLPFSKQFLVKPSQMVQCNKPSGASD